MNIPFSSVNQPEDHVDRAIAAVLSERMSRESLERTMATALNWETTPANRSYSPRHWSRVQVVAVAAVLMLIGVGVFLRFSGRHGDGPPANDLDRRSSDSNSVALSESDHQREPHRFYEPVPMIGTSVADIAPILVTNGPEHPVKLGEKVAHEDVGKGLTDDLVRLHVWDWSKSDLSRVMVVKKAYRGSTLSPDGTLLLGTTGKAIEIATGKTREFKGFTVKVGQRLWRQWFSPNGRYVVALIHLRSEKEQVQLSPPLYSMRHWWSLRVIDLATGKIIDEFPAAGLPAASFSPDETSLIYASPENCVTRRDLATREIQMEYRPSFGVRDVVGIASSRDGRFVAAGHYDGELFIWETQSGKQVLNHKFLRDNGELDRFFQPRVLRFSQDGKFVAMASSGRLKILETRTGRIVAQHYHETTPIFAHLRWSDDGEQLILLAATDVAEFGTDSGFPPKVTADILPRVYEWNWKTGEPALKEFPPKQ